MRVTGQLDEMTTRNALREKTMAPPEPQARRGRKPSSFASGGKGRKHHRVRVETGPKKTPDGYYLIVAEGDECALEQVEAIAREAGALAERAGDKLLIKVKSRRVRDELFKRMKRSFAEAAGR